MTRLSEFGVGKGLSMARLIAGRRAVLGLGFAAAVAMTFPALAESKYDTGASDTEIKIGNSAPYSGPVSVYAAWAKTFDAYFKMINDQGGVNGRKLTFVSYDDAYNPAKAVEATRRLVESDEVFLIFGNIGTPPAAAVHRYLNQREVPQLFVASGASLWDDPENYPWTMGWQPNYASEARVYARHILENYPGKTVGILYQNDDFGKDFLRGFDEVFGDKKSDIVVAEVSFEASSPTVDSQIAQVKGANPDIFVNLAGQKASAQAIKKVGEMGWKPVQYIINISTSIKSVLEPAGLDFSEGVISSAYMKDPNDPQWADDAGIVAWKKFMTEYLPNEDPTDTLYLFGYGSAGALVNSLERAGDDLTRANVMKQAASLDLDVGIMLPGIRAETTPGDFAPIEQLQLIRFNGTSWESFGDIMSGGAAEE